MKIDNGYHIFNDSEMVKHNRATQRSALYRGLGLGAALMAVVAVAIHDYSTRSDPFPAGQNQPMAAIPTDLFNVGKYVCRHNGGLRSVTAQPDNSIYGFKCRNGAQFAEKVTIAR